MSFLIEPKLFASNLRYFREHQSYTVSELARRANLTTAVIQSLESGTQIPAGDQLSQIAAALKIKREQLVLPRPPEIEYYESC